MAPVRNRITKTRARKLRAKKGKAAMPRQQQKATRARVERKIRNARNRLRRQQPDEEIPDIDSETSSVTGLQPYENLVQYSPQDSLRRGSSASLNYGSDWFGSKVSSRRGSSPALNYGSDWFGSILLTDSEGEISDWGNETDNDDASTTYNMANGSSLNMQPRDPPRAFPSEKTGAGLEFTNTTTLSGSWISMYTAQMTTSFSLSYERNPATGSSKKTEHRCSPWLSIAWRILGEIISSLVLSFGFGLLILLLILLCDIFVISHWAEIGSIQFAVQSAKFLRAAVVWLFFGQLLLGQSRNLRRFTIGLLIGSGQFGGAVLTGWLRAYE